MLTGDNATVAAPSLDCTMGWPADGFDPSAPVFPLPAAVLHMLAPWTLVDLVRLLGGVTARPAVLVRGRRFCGLSAVAVCLAAAAPAMAISAPQVSGTPTVVSVDAQNSSVREVLSALRDNFNLQFRSSANLDKKLTGTYRGSLLEVVWRLLEGHDFAIASNNDRLEVTVFGREPEAPEPVLSATREGAIVPCNPEKLADDLKSCFGKSGFSDLIVGACIRNANVLREGFMTCQADAGIRQNYDVCSAEQQIATMRAVGSALHLYRPKSCGSS